MSHVAKQKNIIKRRIPVQARSIERVDKILDSAQSLMAGSKHEKITTHLIAAHASVSVGSVYQFFPNVESVKTALIERLLNQYYDHFSATVASHPTIDNLADFSQVLLTATHDFYQQHPDLTEYIVASSGTREFNEVNRRLNERIHALITNHLSRQGFEFDQEILKRKIAVAIATGDMMTMFIWSAESQQERDAYLKDWRDIVAFYSNSSL